MPQRKRTCPGCSVTIYSRACPVRGKALWVEEELGCLEQAWALQAAGAELCREPPRGPLDTCIASQFAAMVSHEVEGNWGSVRDGWLHVAGACARELLPGLAAHALTAAIALDISGAGNGAGFGAVLDQLHFERELAALDGTEAPPPPCDPAVFERDARKPYVWRPRAALRDHSVGRVFPSILRALEAFCTTGGLDMLFVQRSLELHAKAMTARGALMVPEDLAWTRFIVLAQQAA
ncbi:MAG: hypothetical protein R3B40_27720 [Polyangiales bacterium]|nr:hypothetical protein [Sandaracinaceae bacterium]